MKVRATVPQNQAKLNPFIMAMPFLKLAIVLAVFFFFFSPVPPKSVGLVLEANMKIGSRPPGCVNKCMSCRPCMAAAAAVVVPVHKMKGKAFNAIASSREEEALCNILHSSFPPFLSVHASILGWKSASLRFLELHPPCVAQQYGGHQTPIRLPRRICSSNRFLFVADVISILFA
ncbi:hypothetical protein SDJN02_24309, partial [Cucurbita argyrosperma subsp. argyrosperma]